jgi:hypothetical protein
VPKIVDGHVGAAMIRRGQVATDRSMAVFRFACPSDDLVVTTQRHDQQD